MSTTSKRLAGTPEVRCEPVERQAAGGPGSVAPTIGVPPRAAALSLEMEIEQLRRLELVSLVEATTLVLLMGVAVPLKHVAHWPQGVRWLGPLHGLAFAAYTWTVVQTIAGGGWTRRDATRLFVVAFVPFAGFTNPAFISRRIATLRSAVGPGATGS